jgi:hypothetical protein
MEGMWQKLVYFTMESIVHFWPELTARPSKITYSVGKTTTDCKLVNINNTNVCLVIVTQKTAL